MAMNAWEALRILACVVTKLVLTYDDSLALNRRNLVVLQAHCHECLGRFREFDVRRREDRLDR